MILYWSTVVFNILSGIALTYGIVSFTLRFFIKRKNLILFNHYEKLIKKFPIIMNHGFLDNYANYHNSLSQKDRDFSAFNFWRLLIANRKLNRINHSIHSFIKAYKKNKALTFSSKDLKKHSAKDLKKYRVFIPSFFDILNINIINKEIIYHLESIDFSSFSRGLVTFNFNLEGYNYDILPPSRFHFTIFKFYPFDRIHHIYSNWFKHQKNEKNYDCLICEDVYCFWKLKRKYRVKKLFL